mmetsp:Transcript_33739/g.86422  ORF Transcript_33739/g.86422 Transcript_33739/m.86422 type:complete len:326 (+) Transcript_33739:281-1258(+)
MGQANLRACRCAWQPKASCELTRRAPSDQTGLSDGGLWSRRLDLVRMRPHVRVQELENARLRANLLGRLPGLACLTCEAPSLVLCHAPGGLFRPLLEALVNQGQLLHAVALDLECQGFATRRGAVVRRTRRPLHPARLERHRGNEEWCDAALVGNDDRVSHMADRLGLSRQLEVADPPWWNRLRIVDDGAYQQLRRGRSRRRRRGLRGRARLVPLRPRGHRAATELGPEPFHRHGDRPCEAHGKECRAAAGCVDAGAMTLAVRHGDAGAMAGHEQTLSEDALEVERVRAMVSGNHRSSDAPPLLRQEAILHSLRERRRVHVDRWQ